MDGLQRCPAARITAVQGTSPVCVPSGPLGYLIGNNEERVWVRFKRAIGEFWSLGFPPLTGQGGANRQAIFRFGMPPSVGSHDLDIDPRILLGCILSNSISQPSKEPRVIPN